MLAPLTALAVSGGACIQPGVAFSLRNQHGFCLIRGRPPLSLLTTDLASVLRVKLLQLRRVLSCKGLLPMYLLYRAPLASMPLPLKESLLMLQAQAPCKAPLPRALLSRQLLVQFRL